MRGVEIRRFGPPEVLEAAMLPDATAKQGEVVVKVGASGVNFADVLTRAGRAPGGRSIALPAVLGSEVGGAVVATGPGVDAPKVGSIVVAGTGGLGGYAELAPVPAAGTVLVPEGLDVEHAVALFVQGRTALALARRVRITQGDRVLVLAAAGGVGSVAVQLASAQGALVVGVASGERKTQLVRQLGAEMAVNADDESWPDIVRAAVGEVDVVLDGVGGNVGRSAFELLAPRGRFAIFGFASGSVTAAPLDEVLNRALTVVGFGGGKQLATPDEATGLASEVLRLAADRTVRPLIGQRFTLSDAAAAHRAIERRVTVGKTLLIPEGS
ncbi:MAG TPA: zinc-binding dehydrogenase [Aeromicrobium sp.]|nr:zinc-binding dehydrogenase [Aeromicrobium sp.]